MKNCPVGRQSAIISLYTLWKNEKLTVFAKWHIIRVLLPSLKNWSGVLNTIQKSIQLWLRK